MPEISKMGYARCDIKKKGDNGQIVPEGWSAPSDISSGKVISFHVDYSWNGNNCVINSIKWYPMIYVTDTSNPSNSGWARATGSNNTPVAFSDSFFTQSGKITITLNSSAVTLKSTTGYRTLNAISGDPNRVGATSATTEGTYALMNFKYSYLVKYNGTNWVAASTTETNTTDYSFIEYFIEIKNIKIPKISKYENNIVFTEGAVNELVDKIKKYPIIDIETVASNAHDPSTSTSNNDIIWTKYTDGKPCIKIKYGNTEKTFGSGTTQTTGYKYVAVGSNITFPNETTPLPNTQATGTVRITIDGVTHEIPVYGLSGTGSGGISLGGTTTVAGHLLPSKNAATTPAEWNIGANDKKWHTIYALNGNFTNLIISGTDITSLVPSSKGTTGQFWRGDATNGPSWSDTLVGPLTLSGTSSNLSVGGTATITGVTSISSTAGPNDTTAPTSSNAALICSGAGYFAKNLTASRVFNAVFNDYAECRTTINLTPGHVVIDQDDGSLACSSKRLQPGAQVISDTYGHLMGQTETATTPIAVAGRALVYTYQPRENYHAGMAVCSAPDGTVDIMSRAEICEYPDCIVGIVSEIPQYETWGSDNIKVDGRIWIKVK